MPMRMPRLRRNKSNESVEQPKLRRTKSDDTDTRIPRRFRLRSRSPKGNKPPKGLGDPNDLDDSATASTMDSSCSASADNYLGGGRVRLQRNRTIGCDEEMTPEQRLRHDRLKELPSTANFASNHILVNRERMRLGKAPLHRSRDLDAIARKRAQEMASTCALHKVLIIESMAENVQKGPSIRLIHQMIMGGMDDVSRNNILSDKYHRFGVGCAQGSDGMIYMSQIFQAPAVFSQELKSHLFHKEEDANEKEDVEESKELL